MMLQTEVLIVGAGPTGLVLALWLHRLGVNIRIVDQAVAPAKNSRALAVHARILELYRQLDLADDLQAIGHKLSATNLWVDGRHRTHVPLQEFGRGLTPYPFILTVPQDDHERLLEKRLNALGVSVERCTKLLGFVDHGSSVTATLFREADGSQATCEAAYIVGCDGAHSVVRHGIGATYTGDTYKPLFYIADIEGKESPLFNGEAHLSFNKDNFNLVLPYTQRQHVRLVGITISENDPSQHHDLPEHQQETTFDDVLPQIKQALDIEIEKVNWFSTYRSHHRVADKFRRNREFLVGDAAHIHSPVGGQGMNTGIMDAINLAWKLATVLKQSEMTDEAKEQLLGSYEPERRSFALRLVETTDRGFNIATSKGWFPHFLRYWVLPFLVPIVVNIQYTRVEIFRSASQLILSYRGSNLSQAAIGAGTVQAGDRLPWAKTDRSDNFSTLHKLCWQLHVYGDQRPGLAEWCQRTNVKLFVFDWDEDYGRAGLKRDATYLLRPDHYIAGVFEGDAVQSKLEEYFSSRGLACMS